MRAISWKTKREEPVSRSTASEVRMQYETGRGNGLPGKKDLTGLSR